LIRIILCFDDVAFLCRHLTKPCFPFCRICKDCFAARNYR
jgi:hypothetical protein